MNRKKMTTPSAASTAKYLYMEFGELFRHSAIITKVGMGEFKKRPTHWIQLNQTIFHPQGGGQPADQGTINLINVVHVFKERSEKIDDFEVIHFLDVDASSPAPFKEGDQVELIVDERVRRLHARLHSGGHLLSDVVNQIFPNLTGFMGNHSLSDTYVKFKMSQDENYDVKELTGRAQIVCQEMIQQKLPVSIIRTQEGARAVQISDNIPVPCGGTHITNLEQLGQLEVRGASVNKKDKTVTVKYGIIPNQ